MGNPLNDIDAAKRKDIKESSANKEAEDVHRKNQELNKEIEKLKKEHELKKKESIQEK